MNDDSLKAQIAAILNKRGDPGNALREISALVLEPMPVAAVAASEDLEDKPKRRRRKAVEEGAEA